MAKLSLWLKVRQLRLAVGFDRPERTLEQSGIGPAPDGEGYQAGDGDEDDEKTDETRFGNVEPFHAAALTASDGAATCS